MAKLSNPTGAGPNDIKKNKKKRKKSGPNVVAMKVQAPKANPFETIWSRRKFDILGKKRKGEERRVGLARSLAVEKRKKTLLKEYEQSGKASVFLDKRIGENNDALGEFDKAILRSQRERQLKLSKKGKYNLSDGEEEDFEIQGLGAFSDRDDFEDELLPDDDDYDGEATKKQSAMLNQLNAHKTQNPQERHLIEGGENKHKSKKEVMDEIISKSKYFKAQKAREKEDNEHLMDELDKNFTSLVQSEALLSLTEPGKLNALKALVNKSVPNEKKKKDELSSTQKTENFSQDQPDSYDKLVKEMALEMRARPSDRTKTPEEIAQEERERLEHLEDERQKRMLAPDYSSDEDNDDALKPSTQGRRSISGDDLGDSFSLEEEPRAKKGWVDEILERRDGNDSESEASDSSGDSETAEDDSDEEGSDEDNEEGENNLSLKDWEQSDDDTLGKDLEEGEEEGEEHDDDGQQMEPKPQKKKEKTNAFAASKRNGDILDAKKDKTDGKHSSTSDLPYLIEAPKSFEELSALLGNRSNNDIMLILNRIRTSNAIKLAAENRKKMQVFYGMLLQYFAILANKKPLNFELLNLLLKPLMEMSVEIPYFAAICARQRILRVRMQLCEIIKDPEISSWPSSKTLFLLRLWSMIFPCSDFRHVVMTPAILLMCEYLMRCPIVLGRDIAMGSFLCSMLLSVTRQSQKFCPEAITFLRTLLMAAANTKPVQCQDSLFYYRLEFKALRPLLCIRDREIEIGPLNFIALMDMPEDSPFFTSDTFRAGVLVTVIETLRGYVNIYEGLSSFPEIFLPISVLLLEVAQQENMPYVLQDKFKDVAQLIQTKAEEHYLLRHPLQMRKQKPVPIKLLNPKFEENFVKGRDYDPDRERAEQRKLKKLLNREAKGAARELRKDNSFLYEVKQKDKTLLEEERSEKYGKALAFLQEQEHAFKSGQLGKGKKRMR
ncbi:nucleolar protein 14 isoform X1 [Carya illinoinensis]|uniref:Nucleolar protein 14 n=1 Tax=Carya illinoinensis TaxID=32201 RepID=A0A922EW63_CARIL|nr:nucleolar protein 14 isoform X1 [Carya illinoinensis]KAG6708692.1 hypothetical protein I3842_06G094500 [Carya illinoinensis]